MAFALASMAKTLKKKRRYSIAFWFPEVARGTELAEASLEIREVTALARCEACGAEFPTPSMLTVCPCGSYRFERLKGEELR